MKKITKTIFLIITVLVPSWLQAQQDLVWAYEGFDYYQGTINASLEPDVFTLTGYKNTPTIASQQIGAGVIIPLNEINGDQQNTNAALGLGWAGDWVHSTGTTNENNYRAVGGGTIVAGEVQGFSAPISGVNEDISLVNSGVFGRGGGGTSIGRRLQTSTAGPFFQFELNNAPFAQGTNPVNDGGVDRVDPITVLDPILMEYPSPIRLIGAGNEAIVRHNAEQTSGGPTPITHTNNTWIGAQGSSIWVAVMMRKNAANDEECYISLHRNDTEPWNIDQANTVQIGYFGAASNNAGDRYWGVRVNGAVTAATGSADARITPGTGDEFDLLVAQISFDYTSGHRIRLYVLRDNGRTGYGLDPGQKLDDLSTVAGALNDPTNIDVEVTEPGATTLSFHSLSYFGGASANQSAIDEVRFAGAFENAALTSPTISVIRGLCEESGGTSGENIYPQGNFGVATSVDETGDFVTPSVVSADEILGTGNTRGYDGNGGGADGVADTESMVAGSDNNVNIDVTGTRPTFPAIIKRPDATIAGVEYQNLTGTGGVTERYIYQPNANNQPNDGSFVVATQSRNVFGSWNAFYDNSPDKNGLMMIVNAAYRRGNFFEQTVNNLCASTQYEFFVDIFNIIEPGQRTITTEGATSTCCGNNLCNSTLEPGCQQFSFGGTDQSQNSGIGGATSEGGAPDEYFLNPDVEFLIDGRPVYVPPITVDNDQQWRRVGFTFVTKSNLDPTGNVDLAFRNRAPGGIGNDLALDNITFRPCGPASLLNNLGESNPIEVLIHRGGEGYSAPAVLWQSSSDGGLTWTDLPDLPGNPNPETATAASITDPLTADIPQNDPSLGIAHGDLVRAIIAGSASFLTNPRCRIITDPTTVNCFAALPVNLLNFKAARELDGIALVWETDQEDNYKSFVLERSDDNQQFTAVAAYQAVDDKANYEHKDRTPLIGTNYYRLQTVNNDDTIEYSKVVSVEWSEERTISVHPNPSTNGLVYISFEANQLKGEVAKIKIVNNIGKVEKVLQSNVNQTGQIVINTSDLANGLYVVEITIKNTFVTEKVVIQNN